MSNNFQNENEAGEPAGYRIRVRGQIDPGWTDWFGDVSIVRVTRDETVITCRKIDQAALHGMLKRIRDLGLPLLSVRRLGSDQEDLPETRQG